MHMHGRMASMGRGVAMVLVAWSTALLAQGSTGLDAVRAAMGEYRVRMEHEVESTERKEGKPPLQKDVFTIAGSGAPIQVTYRRHLNHAPDFTGQSLSLLSSDMGIGFGDPSQLWGNWYRGNTIRLLVNGRDVFAEKAATKVERQEGGNGYLHFVWRMEEGRSVVLNLTVPDEGGAVYARVDLALPGLAVESIGVQLNAYPGGFGPLYRLPSHRCVVSGRNEAEVPKGFARTEANPFPHVLLDNEAAWVFFADKLRSRGALGLIVLPEENPSGRIKMSNYGQGAALEYPRETREIHLGFYAFGISNDVARRTFVRSAAKEQDVLREVPFRPEDEK